MVSKCCYKDSLNLERERERYLGTFRNVDVKLKRFRPSWPFGPIIVMNVFCVLNVLRPFWFADSLKMPRNSNKLSNTSDGHANGERSGRLDTIKLFICRYKYLIGSISSFYYNKALRLFSRDTEPESKILQYLFRKYDR